MRKKILSVVCGLIIAIILLFGLVFAWIFYEVLTEEQPYLRKLLDEKTELNYQGEDVTEALEEVETLFQYGEDSWDLGRVIVRLVRNSNGELEYSNIYLYYNPKDETTTRYQRIRLFYENGGWNIAEAYELDQTYDSAGMAENISHSMLKEIMGLVEEQITARCPEGDEFDISASSKGVAIEVLQLDEQQERRTTERLSFHIQETEDGYQLEDTD